MTSEEKAKAYDEMVQRVKELHETGNFLTKKQMEIICPELAESEDERIRREIIECIETLIKAPGASPRLCDWLAYLEKQKGKMTADEFENSDLFRLKLKTKYHNGYQDGMVQQQEKQKEQKPVDDKAFEEWIDDWWKHNKVNNPDSYDKGDEIQFDEKGFKNFCRGIRNMYQQKPDEIDGKALLHVSNKSYDIGFRDGVASVKPAEWSEEDEIVYESIQTILLSEARFVEERKWFDSIKARIKPVCWDEKDEKKRDRLIDRLQFITLNTRTDTTSSNITFFDEIAWLKSLRPQPHWKPSEDQMEALKDASDRDFFNGYGATLRVLYNDLKKLI